MRFTGVSPLTLGLERGGEGLADLVRREAADPDFNRLLPPDEPCPVCEGPTVAVSPGGIR